MKKLILAFTAIQLTFSGAVFANSGTQGGTIVDSKGRKMVGQCLEVSADQQSCIKFKIGIADSKSSDGLYAYFGPITADQWDSRIHSLKKELEMVTKEPNEAGYELEKTLSEYNRKYFYTPGALFVGLALASEGECLFPFCVVAGLVVTAVSPVIDIFITSPLWRSRLNHQEEVETRYMDISKLYVFLVDRNNAGKTVQVEDKAFDSFSKLVMITK